MLEVTLAGALLLVVSAMTLSWLASGMSTSRYADERARSLDDLRLTAAAFSKDTRQATRVVSMSATDVVMDTYAEGAPTQVRWRVTGTDLERVDSGGVRRVFVIDLTNPDGVFSYDGVTVPDQVNNVRLTLVTRPDPRYPGLSVVSDVEMRNAS